jgi:Rod binding domain-containing protein
MGDAINLTGAAGFENWQQSKNDRAVRDLKHPSADNPKRLQDSARAFESLLIGKWLVAAEASLATVPGGSEDPQEDGSVKQLSALGTQALAESITASGGLGIARMLLKSVKP